MSKKSRSLSSDDLDFLFGNLTLSEDYGASGTSNSRCRGRYSKWMTLAEADDIEYKGPGTYQFKARNTDKVAYIGKSSRDVRERIKQHTYSPAKQDVDEYIERRQPDIRVRYKKCENANEEEIRQMDQFYDKHNRLPKYNKKYGN